MDDPAVVQRPNLFLVVARAPLPGFTKTRLGHGITMGGAAQLYLAFLHDIAATFFARDSLPSDIATAWAYTPASFDFEELIASFPYHADDADALFIPQEGDKLGERLTNLIRWSTEHGFERTVVMASDSPQLDPAVAVDAFTALHEHDLVIGRVLDGGYYLVGSRGCTNILERVPMSTADAAQALVELAQSEGLSVAELQDDFDVDTIADLDLLIERLHDEPHRAPATRAALDRLGFAPSVVAVGIAPEPTVSSDLRS